MTRSEYLKLVSEIARHDRLYFVENRPEISDYEYDRLYKQLEKIEKEHPEWIVATSPTQRVGKALTKGFQQVAHSEPMLSLANTYSYEEIQQYVQRVHKLLETHHVPLCAELKIDGVAVSVRYENGMYVRALTRGDGRKGDDITANMKTLRSLPLHLKGRDIPQVLEVRGEVFMPLKEFQRQNQIKEDAGEEEWANPRNAAAGSLKLLDPSETAQRGLRVIFYGVSAEGERIVKTQTEVHAYLHKLGLPVLSHEFLACCETMDEIVRFAEKVEKKRRLLEFDIDGIVLKVDRLAFYDMLGTTGKSPRWAVAYKFAPEQAITKIADITVQVGRTGVLTPVAELEPVFLAGSTIARATLHNQEEIERKDIRVGDTVIIEKGGDVIPKIVAVDLKKRSPDAKPWKMPKHCPSCKAYVVHHEEEVAVRCPNTAECTEQKIRKIAYFSSKEAMDIDHMGEKVVEQLVKKGLIVDLADIYHLDRDDLAKLDGFKQKSIDNLMKSIAASKTISLARFILALGIRYVGEETAEALAAEIDSIEALAQMSKEELLQIEGIGEKMAEAIVAFFKASANRKEVLALLKAGVEPKAPKRPTCTDHPFFGKTFVLTGTLARYTRAQASELIKRYGGKVAGSVSRSVDFVLVGEEAGSKLDKARALQIPILTEEKFESML